MAVLGPIMLALTAGTPILQGRLVVRFRVLLLLCHAFRRCYWGLCDTSSAAPAAASAAAASIDWSFTQSHPHTHTPYLQDTDVRWDTIAGSVDDRTPAERGEVAPEEAK